MVALSYLVRVNFQSTLPYIQDHKSMTECKHILTKKARANDSVTRLTGVRIRSRVAKLMKVLNDNLIAGLEKHQEAKTIKVRISESTEKL